MSDNEISVSTDGVTVKGDVVADLRPAIRVVAKTAESVLKLVDNLVGIPLDFANHNLGRFRDNFVKKYESIPEARRQEPPIRIGYAVLRGAAYSADEPEIQDLFANLLASASDSAKAKDAHPGFATVIGELRAVDARVLIEVSRAPDLRHFTEFYVHVDGIKQDELGSAISNLVRLGLLQWLERGYDESQLKPLLRGKSYPSTLRPERLPNAVADMINDLRELRGQIADTLKGPHAKHRLIVTAFGRSFIAAVVRPQPPGEDTEESSSNEPA